MVVRLNSTAGSIADLEAYVKRLFESYRLSPDLYPNILISLTEAVNNAIKHGNANDGTKSVRIKTSKRPDCLCCRVTDEGQGFDYSQLPDPTSPDNIEQPGGRGVFLMRQLSDEVVFRNNGSTVELLFTL